MNIITVDPSLTCTAVVVNDHKFVFASQSIVKTKTGNNTKWFEITKDLISITSIIPKKYPDYSTQELGNLSSYDGIAETIIFQIQKKLIDGPIKIGMEGYSYSSQAGPLIDLVTFGTTLRNKLYNKISHDITIFAPTTLKTLSAKLTYPPIKKGKKQEWRNYQGISGGKFTKIEMYKALIENRELNCEWVKFLRDNSEDILAAKNIPKPIEDINDAKLMYEIMKENKY